MRLLAEELPPELARFGGYDHIHLLDAPAAGRTVDALCYAPESGIQMTVETTEPSIGFYTANCLSPTVGKGSCTYGLHSGLCFETQHYPDSPNKPHFPSTVLRPGERYAQYTKYAFSIRD